MIYMVAAIAAMAGFLFGFDEGVIAGAEASLVQTFPMTPFVQGFMTAAVPLGALVGAVVSGRIADRYGRRRVLLVAAVVFFVGSLLAAAAQSVIELTLARLMLGVAIGVSGMVAPLYLSESADTRRRGMLVATYQLLITIGILVAYFIDYVLIEVGWRAMFACGALPALLLFVGSLALPESPRWLALRGRTEEARAVLMRLRRGDAAAVDLELAAITSVAHHPKGRFGDLFSQRVRPAAMAAFGLYIFQQLSGINAVIYYAPSIFANTGFESHSATLLATVGVGTVNVLATLVALWLIDRLGRKKLLFAGLTGSVVSLATIAATAIWGGPDWAFVSMIALMVYIAAFAISLGPVPHVMMSEVFPLALRGRGMGLASIANWGFNYIVVLLFPVALAGIGIGGVMTAFAVVCFIGLFFTMRFVPETKGVALEEIERRLDEGRLVRPAAA
jgi:sugar porter (SP) family MFS transporter